MRKLLECKFQPTKRFYNCGYFSFGRFFVCLFASICGALVSRSFWMHKTGPPSSQVEPIYLILLGTKRQKRMLDGLHHLETTTELSLPQEWQGIWKAQDCLFPSHLPLEPKTKEGTMRPANSGPWNDETKRKKMNRSWGKKEKFFFKLNIGFLALGSYSGKWTVTLNIFNWRTYNEIKLDVNGRINVTSI